MQEGRRCGPPLLAVGIDGTKSPGAMPSTTEVTQLLRAYSGGDQAALDALMPLVYDHLRRLAHVRLRAERPDHTLNTTALVHEAYLKLVHINQVAWQDRAHFLAIASRVMRRVLIDYARQRRAQKRGGGQQKVALDEDVLISDTYAESLVDLDEALQRLALMSPRQSQVLEFRYFGGLKLEETATALGVGLTTVKSDLRFARAWLAQELGEDRIP